MMSQDNPNLEELKTEFQERKSELFQLRSKLNNLSQEKEEAYQKLRSIKNDLNSCANKISFIKHERDVLTKEVKELKQLRDDLNQLVKEEASVKKQVEAKTDPGSSRLDETESPGKIKSLIEKLERNIEIEVIPFDKEKKIRSTIKELKTKYNRLVLLNKSRQEAKKASANFFEKRKSAQDVHSKLQHTAQESQQKHEQITQLFEDIKKIRESEDPIAKTYLSLKSKYEELKQQVLAVTKRVNELSKLFDERKEKSANTLAKERTDVVKDKIKQGKKLSTEDILAFQAIKD
ncbi:MAG TPA: hypothetical protein VJI98_04185 [Candidatus Nanoarchaeia archaeon]|nr:hypothetical protein [Candidatus Nanoarchaeia archaeon]